MTTHYTQPDNHQNWTSRPKNKSEFLKELNARYAPVEAKPANWKIVLVFILCAMCFMAGMWV